MLKNPIISRDNKYLLRLTINQACSLVKMR